MKIRVFANRILIGFLALVMYLIHAQVNSGEDITISRELFRSRERNNFLGSFASFFYGTIPDFPLEWWQILLILQLTLTTISLIIWFSDIPIKINLIFLLTTSIQLICLSFSSNLTRDSSMFSFLFLAFSISNKCRPLPLNQSITFFFAVIGFCFRPWLSICLIPILIYKFKNDKIPKRFLFFATSFLLIVLPYSIEKISANIFQIKEAFPQQTFMIHDVASTYCLTANQNSREKSQEILTLIANDDSDLDELCIFYKINTWQGVVAQNHAEKKGHEFPPLKTIRTSDNYTYQKFNKMWRNLIIADPATYVQNHFYFLTQVLLAGNGIDILNLEIEGSNGNRSICIELIKLLTFLLQIPWFIVSKIHLISPLFTFFLFFVYVKSFPIHKNILAPIVQVLCMWVVETSIFFVSDNGRYTQTPSIILIILLQSLLPIMRIKNETK